MRSVVIDGKEYVEKEVKSRTYQYLDPELDNPKWNECGNHIQGNIENKNLISQDSTYEYYATSNTSYFYRVKKDAI